MQHVWQSYKCRVYKTTMCNVILSNASVQLCIYWPDFCIGCGGMFITTDARCLVEIRDLSTKGEKISLNVACYSVGGHALILIEKWETM